MTERFKKAYDALFNAWNNGTLAKGSCVACAVGNIVAAGIGATIEGSALLFCLEDNTYWNNLFWTNDIGQHRRSNELSTHQLDQLSERLYKDTGYTEEELAKVEYAFERNTDINWTNYGYHTKEEIELDQYNGLMAVMDVLIELDEVKEGNTYKETFKEKLQTV